jgi:hypothetical protein
MGTRKFELMLPMGSLFGVTIYKAPVETPDGYRDEPIDPHSLDWHWYANIKTYECVRAAKLPGLMRVLASPIGEGASAYDVPGTMLLVHDLGRVWAMDPWDFQVEYDSVELLVKAMPHGNVGACVITGPASVRAHFRSR